MCLAYHHSNSDKSTVSKNRTLPFAILPIFRINSQSIDYRMKSLRIFSMSIILLLISLYSCQPKEKAENASPAMQEIAKDANVLPKPGFVHAVYFWLKKDNPELVEEFVKEGLPKLAKVPSIQSVSWGPPAGTSREVVDNSYDIAWIVNFASAEDEKKYQVDSLHLVFVEKYTPIFEKVIVYDNIVQHYVSK